MWIIVIEMLLALSLAVFIVWWTMFHRPAKPDDNAGSKQKDQTNEPKDPPRA